MEVPQLLFSQKGTFMSFQDDSNCSPLKRVFQSLPYLSFGVWVLPSFLLSPAESSFLISDFEPQQASAEVGTEDEFDPIPVTGRKNSQGESLTCLWLTDGSG